MTLALSETDTQTASLQRELPQQQAAVPLPGAEQTPREKQRE